MLAPEQHLANTYVGTPYYMSPEIVSDMSYTHKSDIWSLGCIIYELCQLSPPFNAKTQWSLIDKIKQGAYQPIPKQYSPELRAVIEMCLQVDPRQRPDTAELLDMDIFRIRRKERELVLFHRELKSIEEQLKLKDDAIRRKEQHLLLQAEEMQMAYDKRVVQLDNELRAEWEILAHQEIQRQVEIRVKAEMEARLRAKINELDLVPRSMRGGNSPSGHSSLGSSGESSGISSRCDSPSQPHYQRMIPDSPADITMASPSVWGTPGFRDRDYADETLRFGSFGQMLPPDSDPRPQPGTMGPPKTPRRTTFAGDRTITEITNQTSIFDFNEDTARTTLKRPASAFPNGSPTRMPPPQRRQGLQRSSTTGVLNGSSEKKASYGLGGRGSGTDDVATVRKATEGKSMSKARSIVEIQRMQKLVGPAPKWDPNSDEAPSPFLKRNTRRFR
jgi:serine/threonine protein kinase